MKISDLYAKYDIMPQLATHQLRVAGIAKIISAQWDEETAKQCVIACLLHDMGNLVKFENMMDPDWIRIQARYRAKYGTDAHTATMGILLEAGLPLYADYVQEEADLYHATPTTRAIFETASKPAVMILYADLRVKPAGVVSMEERTRDLIERYKNKRTEMLYGPPLEKYIQTLTSTRVDLITEKDVEPFFAELLTYTI